METTNHTVLKIYTSSTDKIGHKLLYEHMIHFARENGMCGVTVYRGIMGYGKSSKHIHSSKFWEITEKVPVVIEMIDSSEKIEAFYSKIEAELNNTTKGYLVTIEPVKIVLHKTGQK